MIPLTDITITLNERKGMYTLGQPPKHAYTHQVAQSGAAAVLCASQHEESGAAIMQVRGDI